MDEYEIVESSPDDFGDVVDKLTGEQLENFMSNYDIIQQEELEKAFPNIEFVVVNPGQVFQAQRNNAEIKDGDSIDNFIGIHFPEWIEKALATIEI